MTINRRSRPDGERIAFRSSREGGGIFVMGRTGEAVRRLTRRGFKPTWSPDGREHRVHDRERRPRSAEHARAELVVGRQRRIGRRTAAWKHRRGVTELVAARTTNCLHNERRHRRQYTVGHLDRRSFRCESGRGHDGRCAELESGMGARWLHLYFVSGRGGPINLWRIPIDEASGRTSGPPEALITPSPFVAHIAISADGTRIAYSSILRSRNIQKLAIDPATGTPRGEPTWITSGSRLWANPDPSPDRKWVVFYSSVQPEGDLYVARTDGTGLRQLTSGADPIDRMPRWSPDGQWIAFHSIRGKDQYLWKIRPDGSDLQQLSPLADAIYPVWSPDGSRIAVLMAAGIGHPENNVYILDPARSWTDQKPEIIPPPAGSPDEFVVNAWSPDGSQLAGQAGLAARGIITYSLRSRTLRTPHRFRWIPGVAARQPPRDVRRGWAGLSCGRYTIAQSRESLLRPGRYHRAAAVDARRTGGVLLASRHRRRHLAPDAVCVKPNAVTCLCQAWLKRARCVTRPFEKSGAPAGTRTRDPRLRRVNSCVGSGLRFNRLRGMPRGCATRLIGPASPRTRRIRPASIHRYENRL